MLITFENHYKNYLGITDNLKNIVSCKRRNEVFSFFSFQLLIMGKYKDNFYYSVAPQYYDGFKNNFSIPDKTIPTNEHLLLIDEAFSYLLDTYQINNGRRLTIENPADFKMAESDAIVPLSESTKTQFLSLFRKTQRSANYLENQWRKKKESIARKNYFLYLIDDKIASYSFISDIDNGGANIVVVTLPQYRRKGLGKAVVSASVNWCFQNDLLPIYLVAESNIASIQLAKSLGFRQMAEEIIIAVPKGII